MKEINKKCRIANLFRLLDEKGITSAQLSKDCGISTGNISDWKSGRATPNANKLSVIAEYLETTSGYLLGYTDEKEKSPAGAELSEKHQRLIKAYDNAEPVVQSTVDRLLGIDEKITIKIAARGGSGTVEEKEITKEQWEKIKELPDLKGI